MCKNKTVYIINTTKFLKFPAWSMNFPVAKLLFFICILHVFHLYCMPVYRYLLYSTNFSPPFLKEQHSSSLGFSFKRNVDCPPFFFFKSHLDFRVYLSSFFQWGHFFLQINNPKLSSFPAQGLLAQILSAVFLFKNPKIIVIV